MYRRVLIAIALLAGPVWAQEPLETLLDRGYVEEWLICGPFDAGETGVIERVSRRLLPVPDHDYLEPVGGVRRVRPTEGLAVPTDAGEVVWQAHRARGEVLDFSGITGDTNEANVFASSVVRTTQAVEVLIDLQTVLGARLWLNGFPVAAPAPVSPVAAGLQRHVARLRRGDNHLLLQVPLASLDALATAEGSTPQALRDAVLATRPMLANATGFEAALRLRPAARAGQLVYVPRFIETGRFTGQGNTLAQELAVELFNPGPGNTGPAMVRARFGAGEPWIEKAVRAIPPQTQVELLLGMPVSGFKAGEARAGDVQIETANAKGAFHARVPIRSSPARGTAYVLTGLTGPLLAASQSEDAARRITTFSRLETLLSYESDFGFYLGGTESWLPFLMLNPQLQSRLRDAAARGRIRTNAGSAMPDERVASGELLARNLLHGQQTSLAAFGIGSTVYYDSFARGIAPQSAQLLADSQIVGRAMNPMPLSGHLGPLWLTGLDGRRVAGWSIEPFPEVRTPGDLQAQVAAQRDALGSTGVDAGIYVSAPAAETAPVYLLNETAALLEGIPSIRFDASGPERVFELVREYGERNPIAFDDEGSAPTATALGEIIAQRPLKDAYAYAESLTNAAERFSALAAMQGATYPRAPLDRAWQQLLFHSEPNVLGRAESSQLFIDALSGFHESTALANDVLKRAIAWLAGRINTASTAPRNADVRGALVVFNPSFQSRSDTCEWRLPTGSGTAFSIVDAEGARVPHHLQQSPGAATALFVARDVPPLGYRTYFVVAGGGPAATRPGSPNTIENAHFRITVDPERGGGIANLESKRTGTGVFTGLGNDVLILQEDAAHTNAGREIWIDGIADRASDHSAQVQTERSEVFERLRITTPLAGGEVTRTITLFKNLPRIDFETSFRGVNARNRTLAVAFDAAGPGHTLMTGERFGVTVNGSGSEPLLARTASGEFQSDSQPRHAYGWAALSANDHVRAGANVAVPVDPSIVVYGSEQFEPDARALARALAQRGIPATAIRADDAESRTRLLGQGHSFAFIIGGTDQNPLTSTLLERLEPSAREGAVTTIEAGQPFAIANAQIGENSQLSDTLILGGRSPAQTQALVSDVIAALRERGAIEIPPRAYAGPSPRPLPTRGLAFFFDASNLVGHGQDGSLSMLLARDSAWDASAEPASVELAPMHFSARYTLMPFEGDWRSGNVPFHAQAFRQPLRTAYTSLRLGELPLEHSFGSTTNKGFVVTALKAAQSGPATVLRGYEAHGTAGTDTTLNLSLPLTRVWRSNPTETGHNPVQARSNGFRMNLEPFTIATYAFEAAVSPAPGALAATHEPAHSHFTRYWLHNAGPAPNTDPAASVLLDGSLDDENVYLRVQNRRPSTMTGTVALTAPAGWTIAPEAFGVNVGPNESLERRILVIRPEQSPGGLIAELRTGAESYRDVLMTNPEAFDLLVERSDRELIVRLQNRFALPLSGAVEVIAPPDAWPETRKNDVVDPWRIEFDLGPLEEHRTAFVWQGDSPARWYAVKAHGNGHVAYASVK